MPEGLDIADDMSPNPLSLWYEVLMLCEAAYSRALSIHSIHSSADARLSSELVVFFVSSKT